MPDLKYNVNEIKDHGKHTVNASGYLYVGRKYHGEVMDWILLKDEATK